MIFVILVYLVQINRMFISKNHRCFWFILLVSTYDLILNSGKCKAIITDMAQLLLKMFYLYTYKVLEVVWQCKSSSWQGIPHRQILCLYVSQEMYCSFWIYLVVGEKIFDHEPVSFSEVQHLHIWVIGPQSIKSLSDVCTVPGIEYVVVPRPPPLPRDSEDHTSVWNSISDHPAPFSQQPVHMNVL